MDSMKPLIVFMLLGIIFLQPLISEVSPAASGEIKLTTPFPRIEISEDKDILLDIEMSNTGDTEELLDLTILKPEGWEASLKSGDYVVTSIYLTPNENRSVVFLASPPSGLEKGSYTFVIEAQSRDDVVKASLSIQVDVTTESVVSPSISLSTPYPFVEGPAGKNYELTLAVENLSDEDRVIGLSAFLPQDWGVVFRVFEEILVSSLDFRSGETKRLSVMIAPAPDVRPDTYNLTIVASSGDLMGTLGINITITGSYAIGVSTSDGLLSAEALQGEETHLGLTLRNIGTAPLKNVFFSSDKPIGWDVIFLPDDFSILEPGTSREAIVSIKPVSDAIPGDYSVTISAIGEPFRTEDSLDLKVTVRASVTWGFVGIGIILAAAVLLLVIFWRLGRR